MIIELAPLLMALPALLVSNVSTISPADKLEMTFIALLGVSLLQAMCLASLTIILVSALLEWMHINGADYSDENTNLDRSQVGIFHNVIGMWFPLVCVFTSNEYLGPIRTISLIFIFQLVGKSCNFSLNRSLQLENIYNVSNDNQIMFIFKKYQQCIILLLSFILNTFSDWILGNQDTNFHLIGFAFLSLPILRNLLISFFKKTVDQGTNDGVHPNGIYANKSIIKVHFFIMLSSFGILVLQFYDKFNLKMLIVSAGSICILIISQLDGKKRCTLKTETFLNDVIDYNVIIDHYKIYYTILNVAVLIISFLNNSFNPEITIEAAMKTFLNFELVSFGINMLLITFVHVDTSKSSKSNQGETIDPSLCSESNHSILSLFVQLINSKESKSIFNFLLLNVAFMFIQLLYSFRSKSLSLLSDSLHMFLDCISLLLGLLASIISKNNDKSPNNKYPFGLSRIGTLSGFTNGSLLLGIVFGIFNESIQRFFNPVQLENTTELLIVSTLGFLVNLVGIFAFNHGHDHAHGHGHSHGHSHSHEHSHTHEPIEPGIDRINEHNHCQNSDHDDFHESRKNHDGEFTHEHTDGHKHDHIVSQIDCEHQHEDGFCQSDHKTDNGHGHSDDNMHGIFLHIMADTLGSVGVILSTIVVKLTGWSFVDPLASIMIASLILLSSIPLLKSSSSNLLLSLNDDTEQKLKQLLGEVLDISGVKSYTTPRFWPQDGPNSKLVGYLHVQYFRTENSLVIKNKIDRLFAKSKIINKFYLQLENEVDECWCRKEGIFSTF